MQYTQSLGALGKKERGRKKSAGSTTAERMDHLDGDVSMDSISDQHEVDHRDREDRRRLSVDSRSNKREASIKKEVDPEGEVVISRRGAAAPAVTAEDEDEDEEDEADVTRCVCGITGELI